ncbi:potassium/proton antiporter [Blastococcus mobilis]|uniref:Potassium/proton antiporter, CPA1 family n=1 Tax=Blastococcus mobilis TaxID=1938746 RepID=A0A238ZA96_9ACTN|nr:potassium/proton antiporter [Blastococcus mobilis]SNR80210.1 potassium/proton antiporter, CPA1 family [Blastococcus mobilis]
MSVADLNVVVLAVTALLLVAVAAVRLSSRAGLPTLLIYLGLGVIVGEAGFGLEFEDAELTQVVGLVLLGVILAEGGLTTRWSTIRPVLGASLLLATLGVALSVAVTAAVTYALLDVNLRTAILLGAVVSSTDAAAVFSVLRRLPLRRRLGATLEAESGFNDPLAIILVTLVVSDGWEQSNPLVALAQVFYQLAIGAVVGLLVARVGESVLRRSALPSVGLYPIATVAIVMLAFAAAGVVAASSFMAVYVAALWLGNARLPHRNATLGFAEGLAWLSQISLFVLLGLLASPQRLPAALLPALIVGGALLLLARPLSVVVCATPFQVPWREQAFMSWAGLRGAVPIVLATIPVSARLPAAQQIFDIVFVLVVLFTLVQAPTLPPLARRLGVCDEEDTAEVAIESAPLGSIDADLLEFSVPAGSKLHGVAMWELRLPPGAVVSVILRDGHTLVPDRQTTLRHGDQLLLIVPSKARRQAERRLRAVHRAGRLASWLGEQGETDPQPIEGRIPQVQGRWDRAVRRLRAAASRRAGLASAGRRAADIEPSPRLPP